MIHNKDGRPCAWGLAPEAKDARKEAERQWASYVEKNPGTERGQTHSHMLPDTKATTRAKGGSI